MNKNETKADVTSVSNKIFKPFSITANEFRIEMHNLVTKHNLDPITAEILIGRIYSDVLKQAEDQFRNEQADYQKQLTEKNKDK